jgi:hypothetical protein
MKNHEYFLGHNVGDVVTLTDLQTQAEFNQSSVDFKIVETREYKNDAFHITCYLISGPNEVQYMVMVKKVGEAYDVFVYYLDTDGGLHEDLDGKTPCPFYALLSPDLKDLTARIEVTVNFKDGTSSDVNWDKQNTTFPVNYTDSQGLFGLAKIADYATNSDNHGNNRCFVVWIGDHRTGMIEMWYGCLIKEFEIEIYSVKK